MSSISPGWVGFQPRSSLVSALDVGLSSWAKRAEEPEVLVGLLGRDARYRQARFRPMASAISRNGTPSSPTACSRVPAGADSSASRYRCAASSVWPAGQRFAPSPT